MGQYFNRLFDSKALYIGIMIVEYTKYQYTQISRFRLGSSWPWLIGSISRNRGKAITSWILSFPVRIIMRRSRPIPHPAHGIKPYYRASTKSISVGVFTF